MKPLLQITERSAVSTASPSDITRLKKHFAHSHYVLLKQFIAPVLLTRIQTDLHQQRYYQKRHKGLAKELCMRNNALSRLLHFYIHDQTVFDFVQKITDSENLGCFHGRIYQMKPEHGHYHRWHTDWSHHRLLAMSINLSTGAYSGGHTIIRDAKTRSVISSIQNTGFGDAIIFRLSPQLEHRVTQVEGDITKTAFAGWFASRPHYLKQLKSTIIPLFTASNVKTKSLAH